MSDCLFCKIIADDLPSFKVYEGEKVIAFLDINQAAPGKTLVIPRDHIELLTEMPPDLLADLIRATQKVAVAVGAAMGADGINLLQSNGTAAGQEVPHVHFHVVPRRTDDGLQFGARRLEMPDEERRVLRDKIRSQMTQKP